MRKRSTVLVVVTAALCVLAIPVVGPWTFYETVVPPLSPIIPKPDGVPSNAKASFNVKAFGLFWKWKKEFPSGCAAWGKADDFDFDHLRLTLGSEGCQSNGLTVKSSTDPDSRIVFDFGRSWRGGESCPLTVSETQIDSLKTLVRDVTANASTQIEHDSVSGVLWQLEAADGEALVTEHNGGCSRRNLQG